MIVHISCSINCACLPCYLIDGTVKFTRTIDAISAKFYSNSQGFFSTRNTLSLLAAMPFIEADKGVYLIHHSLNSKDIVTRHKVHDEPDKVDDNPQPPVK